MHNYPEFFERLMNAYLRGEMSAAAVANEAIAQISPDADLGGNNDLLANCFVALSHLAEPGWKTTDREIRYLLKCLSGAAVFSLTERDRAIALQ